MRHGVVADGSYMDIEVVLDIGVDPPGTAIPPVDSVLGSNGLRTGVLGRREEET